jgi:hypothetical protein
MKTLLFTTTSPFKSYKGGKNPFWGSIIPYNRITLKSFTFLDYILSMSRCCKLYSPHNKWTRSHYIYCIVFSVYYSITSNTFLHLAIHICQRIKTPEKWPLFFLKGLRKTNTTIYLHTCPSNIDHIILVPSISYKNIDLSNNTQAAYPNYEPSSYTRKTWTTLGQFHKQWLWFGTSEAKCS